MRTSPLPLLVWVVIATPSMGKPVVLGSNGKSEIRISKSETNSNPKSPNVPNALARGHFEFSIYSLSFVLVSNFGFRASDCVSPRHRRLCGYFSWPPLERNGGPVQAQFLLRQTKGQAHELREINGRHQHRPVFGLHLGMVGIEVELAERAHRREAIGAAFLGFVEEDIDHANAGFGHGAGQADRKSAAQGDS